jgi:hypothetical protein
MNSKTYFSKPNNDIEYIETKNELKQIVSELILLTNKLKQLIDKKEKKW